MQNKFTQPVSMQVTKEQYEKDLREPLLRMGYKEVCEKECEDMPILVTNYGSTIGEVSNTSEWHKKDYNRHFINHYNPNLFLAIAAMSNEEYGIYGEWWYCIKDVKMKGSGKVEYNRGKLYMGLDNKRIVNNSRNENYFIVDDYRFIHFRKVTIQELITYFTENKKQNIMKEITTELIEGLKKLITPENEEKFNKLMGIEKPIFKKEDFRFGDKVMLKNGDILFVIPRWKKENRLTEEFGLFNISGAVGANDYCEKLLNKKTESGNIQAIYRPKGEFIPVDLANDCLEDYNLIWSRE